MPPGVACPVAGRDGAAMLPSTAADGRPARSLSVELLLVAALVVTALVVTLTAVWVVPAVLIAALAAAADDRPA